MSNVLFARVARLVAVVTVCLVAAACSQTRPELGADGSVVPGSGQDFVVNVGDRVFFNNNQSSLSPAARATLDKQAQWLNAYSNYTITIEGHADERGTRQYNIALGARRAQAVYDYLSAKGVSQSRIKTISYGKERPVAVCDADSCWSQNRRAVTVVNNAGS
ncbi:peptidoglycan-associated lipoprotein Pal [Pseudovibrio exalbescens]|uniref:peptidoglycan-associated lipoprotein Pal n=1 Tax=Pseudovibrio exalbescens TaxID=197461 RepID=UPI002365C8BE|nr:peptidoglycan-associated lipoprotein Pal [Pseudovibrio exalbescens]MDD7911919.1 peptidoglycan-associated lipoprotein Pal [Pseudovibrio exalbescens]